MKTKIIAILAMLMFTFTSTQAKDPKSLLTQTINSKISFPTAAVQKHIEGTVFAEFKVAEDGKIEVVNCFSAQGELQSYVFLTLSGIKVTPDEEIIGKIYSMRFDFKLI
ncbi:MAG: hypothetical protein HGB12_07180 [Bacteroidetes bacterium]|nr:hypothetical protein [Bacteroidota bacterium]